MRQALRLFTIVSFFVFVIAAMLAFSVRPASAAPTTGDAGADAGSSDLAAIFGAAGDRSYLAGSKAFGAPVAPQGFGGLGLRGDGSGGVGVGDLLQRPRVVDIVVRGPLPSAAAERVANGITRPKFGVEPCVVGRGVVVVELAVKPDGHVERATTLLVDGGLVRGAGCLAERAATQTFPAAKGPSTVLVTWLVAPGR